MHDKNSDLELIVACGFDKNNLDYLKSISKIKHSKIIFEFLNEEEF